MTAARVGQARELGVVGVGRCAQRCFPRVLARHRLREAPDGPYEQQAARRARFKASGVDAALSSGSARQQQSHLCGRRIEQIAITALSD